MIWQNGHMLPIPPSICPSLAKDLMGLSNTRFRGESFSVLWQVWSMPENIARGHDGIHFIRIILEDSFNNEILIHLARACLCIQFVFLVSISFVLNIERWRSPFFRFTHINCPVGKGDFNTSLVKSFLDTTIKRSLQPPLLEWFGGQSGSDDNG